MVSLCFVFWGVAQTLAEVVHSPENLRLIGGNLENDSKVRQAKSPRTRETERYLLEVIYSVARLTASRCKKGKRQHGIYSTSLQN